MDILTSEKNPEWALRRMNEAGVFGRFMPDFGRVVAQMQYNMYHHFTVDEHTIISRFCFTTSPRAGPATIPGTAPKSPTSSARASA
jgi:hypothetical protein